MEVVLRVNIKQMLMFEEKLPTRMHRKACNFLLVASMLVSATSCNASETVSNIKCEAYGDAVVAANTGETILEQRLIKYQELEEYGRNMSGNKGGQRAICTIKNDPPGYKWLSCGKDGTNYITYATGSSQKLFEVEEVITNSVQHRGWSGACKVKL